MCGPAPVRSARGVEFLHRDDSDARTFPGAQTAEEVAQVIAEVIESRRADVYTRADGQAMVARYYATDITG
jgi:hypothetical protein